MEVLHQVVSAVPLDDSKIKVTFETGATGVFDCAPYMADRYWHDLNTPAFFRQVRAECGTLCWPNDIDIDPEEIWEDTVFDEPQAQVPSQLNASTLSVAEDSPEYDARPPASNQ